jgi:hypothetical protein
MHITRILALAVVVALLSSCNPSDRRPGSWLSGEPAPYAADWAFTNDIQEIAVQVHTPYLIPHSVTIWCASLDGQLYVGARAPETKRWPGWVDRDPNVVLGIAGKLYDVTLLPLDDAATLSRLTPVYAHKYGLPDTPEAAPRSRYWHVTPRA